MVTYRLKIEPKTLMSNLINRRASAVLKELLTQLSNVSKAQMANNNEAGQISVVSNDVGSLKKKAYIQLMAVKILAFLSWDLTSLNDTPTLQLVKLAINIYFKKLAARRRCQRNLIILLVKYVVLPFWSKSSPF